MGDTRVESTMIIEARAAGPFVENGYVVGCERTREAVIIDPGDSVDQLLAFAARERLQIRHILLTHAHLDHVSGVAAAKRALAAPVYLHKDDLFLYEGVVAQGASFGVRIEPQPKIDVYYSPGQVIAFGDLEARPHHTPGHCPGGVCLAIAPKEQPARDLFVGDTLFAGSIGRTDLPGGDYATLIASITNVLFSFGDDAVVYSGHGPTTTIGRERTTNPWLRGQA